MVVYYMTFGAIFAAFGLIAHNFINLKAHDEGNELTRGNYSVGGKDVSKATRPRHRGSRGANWH